MKNKTYIAGTLVAAGLACSGAVSAEEHLKGFPLAILCGHNGQIDLAYLGRISVDGTATYTSAVGQRVLTITADGPAEAAVQTASGSECIGKTLEVLRNEGRTVEARN